MFFYSYEADFIQRLYVLIVIELSLHSYEIVTAY